MARILSFLFLFLSACTSTFDFNLKPQIIGNDGESEIPKSYELKFSDDIIGLDIDSLNNKKLAVINNTLTYNYSYTLTGECDPNSTDVLLSFDMFKDKFPDQSTACTQEGLFSFDILSNDLSDSDPIYNYVGGIKVTISQGSSSKSIFLFSSIEPKNISTITNLSDLQNISTDSGTLWVLTNDIDVESESSLAENNWNLVGGDFDGHFYFTGLNFKISNLHYSNTTKDYVSIFPFASSTSISYLRVDSSHLEGKNGVGSIISYVDNVNNTYNFITNIIVTNTTVIGAGTSVGGISGEVYLGIISKVFFAGSVTSTGTSWDFGFPNSVGGIAGLLNNASCDQCMAIGQVIATENRYVGGISGLTESASSISNSAFIGSVHGNDSVGGISGKQKNTDIETSYAHVNYIAAETETGSGAGPIRGVTEDASVVTNSYFSYISCYNCDNSIGTELTDPELAEFSFLVGFTSDYWYLEPSYNLYFLSFTDGFYSPPQSN